MVPSTFRVLSATCAVLCAAVTAPAVAGETKGFVVDWFHLATLAGSESCPTGLNPLSDVFYKRELKRLGYSSSEVEKLLKDFPNGAYMPITTNRGRVDGKPVNIYAKPWSQPDPGLIHVSGKRAYGFDLDGRDDKDDFVEPVTGEKGVDNQLYRALGCTQSHTGALPSRPGLPQTTWDLQRDYMPAWLVEVSGIDDPMNDDTVEIGLYRARSPVERDASGDVRSDTTMWVDPDPRNQNRVRGRIKNGVITSDTFDMRLLANPMFMAEYKIDKAHLRFQVTPEGRLQGVVGGYQSWETTYFGQFGSQGWATEHSAGVDMPAIWYAMEKLADYDPDPKTGKNRQISGTYWLEAVPAFLKHSGGTQVSQAAK